jgi:predicted site-specific integrase-resolvase
MMQAMQSGGLRAVEGGEQHGAATQASRTVRTVRVALYARVSTERQQHAHTIGQQMTQLREFVAAHASEGWVVREEHVFVDDGYSGARLNRPGLDTLRDQAARAAFEVVLVTSPDRLARNYVHQMVVLEELERHGCEVLCLDRPLPSASNDPHEQLVVQIRGAVAEYERTLIALVAGTGCGGSGKPSCAADSCCRGRVRPTATDLMPSGRAIRLACGLIRPKPLSSRRCSPPTLTVG